MQENTLRQRVADTIKGWVGAAQYGATHTHILKIYNEHKPLARGYKVQPKDAWCATTASAAYIKAGVSDYTGTECSCAAWIEIAKKKGIWIESDAYVPKVGDACVYDWDDTGKGDNKGAPEHIGIVTKAGLGAFEVTEGNKGKPSKVGVRTMAVNGKYIRGFIAPDFAKAARELSGRSEVDDAIERLAELGVINSPNTWTQAVASGKVQYLDALLIKAAAKARHAGYRASSVDNAVGTLVAAGVINTPDYWLAHQRDIPFLGDLLCALAGAVR